MEDEEPVYCCHCGAWMDDYPNPDLWQAPSYEDFALVHASQIRNPDSPNPPVGHPHVVLSGTVGQRKVCLYICPACGWWLAEDRAVLPAVQCQQWVVTLASSAALEDFALNDIGMPLDQVRRYLARRFEARVTMHPRLLELTVASVFKDLGYRAQATAYSNDGGVDVVVVDGGGARIGVQVRRRRGLVQVEQIRAFLGALVLGGYARGVFVSTSSFTRGAREAAVCCNQKAVPVELIDASRFFAMLGYAQLMRPPRPEDCGISQAQPLQFHGRGIYQLNSL